MEFVNGTDYPIYYAITGWWLTYPLKNDGVKVSWDDEIPNIWKNEKMFQTTNQINIYIYVKYIRLCYKYKCWSWFYNT